MANFEVGSIFKIIDEASPVLRKPVARSQISTNCITDTRANPNKLARTQFSGLENPDLGIDWIALPSWARRLALGVR